MKFDLLFLSEGQKPLCRASAYIYVSEHRGYGENARDPRYGKLMLTPESMSEVECHRQIDRLISNLEKLKTKASRKFQKR